MPQIAPITLHVGETDEIYQPTSFDGKKAVFTDSSPSRVSQWRLVKVTVRPAAPENSGHMVEHLMVRPNPVVTTEGCCVDPDSTKASTVSIRTLLQKDGPALSGQDLVDATTALVASAAFQSLVKGAGYY